MYENGTCRLGSRMRLGVLAAAVLLSLLCDAHATAGFSCNTDDASVTVSFLGGYRRSIGAGIANFGDHAEHKIPGPPADARKLTFEAKHLSENSCENRVP
jgi:hypothetical protein